MANNVLNKVLFLGKDENVNKAKECMGPEFDLNNIVREPEGLGRELGYLAVDTAKKYCSEHGPEDDPKQWLKEKNPFGMYERVGSFCEDFLAAVDNYRRTGYYYWLDWRKANWGCKWNTYDHAGEQMTFFTANAPCRKAYAKISEKFGITVKVMFADEDKGYNCGILVAKNGVLTEWNPEAGTQEAIEFAENIWGC